MKPLGQKSANSFKQWISSIILLPVIVYLLINKGRLGIIDYINLLIHEGGHGVFSFYSKFIQALGGTAMQIFIPLMFVVYYILHRKRESAQIFMVWLGQNLLNIAIYAADARARKIPLLGGKKVYHDWHYMLSELGLLQQDYYIGQIFYWLGVISFLAALILPLFIRDYKPAMHNLNL